jgi:hypothetical protein
MRLTFPPISLDKVSGWYDTLFNESNISKIERVIINFALVGFLLHLGLIFLTKHFVFGNNFFHITPYYLRAIYTPFSIVLFYEVLMLVMILPQSISSFIGKQYEIITLIAIRSFFHDIAEYDLDKPDIYTFHFLGEIGVDLIGALLLFFLTTLYYLLFAKTKATSQSTVSKSNPKRIRFINIKKTAAVILTLLLIILSVVSLSEWGSQSFHAAINGGEMPNSNVFFYKEFFSVMIFVDVFLLILSFIYSTTYALIFRNAGFVISTILVRISLTAEKPFNLYFALTAVLFGVLLIALFLFYNRSIHLKNEIVNDEE